MGVRKDYKPYWSNEMQKTHDALTKAREEAETNPSQENNINLQQRKAKHLRTELECQRWREKTSLYSALTSFFTCKWNVSIAFCLITFYKSL
jgi:hypothetical protein